MAADITPFRIEEINLDNFRCFESEKLTFSEPFTLLLGDNGAGKTALIEALGISIGAFMLGVDLVRAPNIKNSDVRESIHPDDLGSVMAPPELVIHHPTTLAAKGIFGEKAITWRRTRRDRGDVQTAGNSKQIENVARELAEQRSQHVPVLLPLLAHYPAHRAAPQHKDAIRRTLPPDRWERGYDGALDARLNQDVQIRWVRSMTLSAVQQGSQNPMLDAVLRGVAECLEGYSKLYFSIQLDELVAVDGIGKQRRAHLLSAGYWTTLILMLDMAYRCAQLNPHLGEDLLKETPGIVLIDELDLHLHPRWQRRIVADMHRVFPRIQFIATTHSPLIGASLPSSSLYCLKTEDDGLAHARKFAEQSLGLSPDQMLSTPYFDLESDRPVQAEERLDELADRILKGDSDAALEYMRLLNSGTEVAAIK